MASAATTKSAAPRISEGASCESRRPKGSSQSVLYPWAPIRSRRPSCLSSHAQRGFPFARGGHEVCHGRDANAVEARDNVSRREASRLRPGSRLNRIDREPEAPARCGRGMQANKGEDPFAFGLTPAILGARAGANVEHGMSQDAANGRGARRRGGKGDLDIALERRMNRPRADAAEESLGCLPKGHIDPLRSGDHACHHDFGALDRPFPGSMQGAPKRYASFFSRRKTPFSPAIAMRSPGSTSLGAGHHGPERAGARPRVSMGPS